MALLPVIRVDVALRDSKPYIRLTSLSVIFLITVFLKMKY